MQQKLLALTAEEKHMKVDPKDHKIREQIRREKSLRDAMFREMEDNEERTACLRRGQGTSA